eukprot:458146_1
MTAIGKKLAHEEDETSTTRYTLAYPDLPADLEKLIEGEGVDIPDYSDVSIDDLTEKDDNINSDNSKISKSGPVFVTGYANQGGYDASLDWEPEKTKLRYDSFFTQNALHRRALIAGGKGVLLGLGVGGLMSLWAIRFMTLTHQIPISFHVYTMGGSAFMFGGMNAVHQARRYKEFLGFKKSGVANPQEIGIKDAKSQMVDWMSSTYDAEYVERWKQSEEADQQLANLVGGTR